MRILKNSKALSLEVLKLNEKSFFETLYLLYM